MIEVIRETKPDYLFDYGIQNEGSDIRAHVCPLAGIVYVFPTVEGVRAISSKKRDGRSASQPGYNKPTAFGYPVPVTEIGRCVPVWAKTVIAAAGFFPDDSPSFKGERAVRVVAALLRMGWFPLPVDPLIIGDADMQISGTDINVRANFRIQVKCDYKGGVGPGCTGKLFLQTAEINPLKRT